MSRYKDLNIRTSNKQVEKLETAYYPEIVETNSDIWVLTQDGDRFDRLAHQFYGDPELWWFIAKANNMKFNNIPAGRKIRIPASPSGAYAVKSKDSSYLREQDGTSNY